MLNVYLYILTFIKEVMKTLSNNKKENITETS